MTIASPDRGRVSYTASGSNNDFAYTYMVFLSSHLQIQVIATDGTTYDLTLSTDGSTDDYTVDGVGNGTGGTVTLLDNSQAWMTGGYLTVDYEILILRTVPLSQLANLRGEGGYKPATNENEMDLLTMGLQQIQDTVDRSITLPASEGDRAGMVQGFDDNGDPVLYPQNGIVARLSDSTPQSVGTPTAGVSGEASRADHVHGDKVSLAADFDGNGVALVAPLYTDIYIPFALVLESVVILADQSGSAAFDIRKDTYANYPPTGGDSIVGAAPPTLSSATKSKDTTLTGWTTPVAADTTIRVYLSSVSTCTKLKLQLNARRA